MSITDELTAAISKRDIDLTNRLLDEHPELLDEDTESGVSFVVLALYSHASDIIRTLQARGAVRSAADAVAADDIELLATYLSRSQSDASAYTHDGWTPLHLACRFGNEAAATTLVSHGADVNAWSKNDLHNQPLHAGCAGSANEAIVKTLIDAGAEVNTAEQGGFTPLQLAAGNGNLGAVQLLLSHGADRLPKTDGKSAYDLAMDAGHAEIAERLRSR